MAKKKTASNGPYKVLIGFDSESGSRYEIGDTIADVAKELTPADLEALIEMDAIEEVE